MQDRWVIHSDINNFFAAVACLKNPAIRKLPVAICGDIKLRHGIVMAKNMLAKDSGVKTAITNGQALEKCPELHIEPPDEETYDEFSKDINYYLYSNYSNLVEKFSIDESFIDITDLVRDKYDARIIADEIRIKMREEYGLTCSVGVSFNKSISKLASDLYKPDATTIITRENFKEIVWKLPADSLIGIGKSAMRAFKIMKITTIGDIAIAPVDLMEKIFGKWGWYFHRYANGEENSSVKHKEYVIQPKTIGNVETTPRDMKTIEDVKRVIYMLSERVTSRMREQNYKCRTVQVSIREYDLKFCERQGKLEQPSYITNNIAEKAMDIFKTRYNFTKPLRSIGVKACDLVPETVMIQNSFFDDIEQDEKREKIAKTMDRLRNMFGYEVIKRGITLEDKILTTIPTDYNRSSYRIGSSVFNKA